MYEGIKILVADIDSTLRYEDRISERTVNTIKELRRRGYLFGLASGKPFDDVEDMHNEWGIDEQFDFLVCWNGSQLYDNSTCHLYEYNFLKKDELKEIFEFMKPFDAVVSEYKPGIYLCNKQEEYDYFLTWSCDRRFVVSRSDEEFYCEDNGGIMFRTTPQLMSSIEKEIKDKLQGRNYIGFKTTPDLIEFSNKESNKGYAFRKYCELHRYSLNDCIAFGDTSNDNRLLECCHGVCMLNGSDDTKACAERITDLDCQNDGWADFVEKYILNINK